MAVSFDSYRRTSTFGTAVGGGLGDMGGAVAAGLIIGLLESFTAGLLSSGYKDAVALVILVMILYFRPAGIFHKRDERRLVGS